jgi:hypothetical protein
MGRFMLVELERDLDAERTTWNTIFLAIRHVPGVRAVADLEALSVRTLAEMMARGDKSEVPSAR